MKDTDKTKQQLITELVEMRQRVTESEASQAESKRAEMALRESEQISRDVAESALEWIWEANTDGKYTYASPAYE